MKRLIPLIIPFCFFACDDIIEVVDISDEIVTVLAPADGSLIENDDITFTWEAVEEADSYKIQIAIPSFEAATQIITDSLVTTTYFNRLLDSGRYEWRVRAENSGYITGYSTQKITVLAPDPVDISSKQMIITVPANNATFLTTDIINFLWEPIQGANQYTIQIAKPGFDSPTEIIKNEITTNTIFSVSNLSKSTYEFRIKAKNSGFETGYMEIRFVVN